MKKFNRLLICSIVLLSVSACSGETSISEKLEKLGYEENCEDNICSIFHLDTGALFKVELSDSTKSAVFFNQKDTYGIIYKPEDKCYFYKNDSGRYCALFIDDKDSSDCSKEEIELILDAKVCYDEHLEKMKLTEKELWDYLNEKVDKAFKSTDNN